MKHKLCLQAQIMFIFGAKLMESLRTDRRLSEPDNPTIIFSSFEKSLLQIENHSKEKKRLKDWIKQVAGSFGDDGEVSFYLVFEDWTLFCNEV